MNDETELWVFNHGLFPKIHISRPITSPAESAIYHKNLILIGMGSGIAPYLSLVEEQSNLLDDICQLNKKKTVRAFNWAHIIFVVWSNDEISWISHYLDKILEKPALMQKI